MNGPPIVRLTKESIIYGLGQAIGRALQMILVPVFTRVFRPAEYGVIDVLALLSTIAAMLIIMGTDAALARYFYEARNQEDRTALVSTLAVYRIGLALAVSLVLWSCAAWLSRAVLASPDYAKYVRIAAWSLPFTVFVFFQNDVLRLTFQPWKFIILNLLNTLAVGGLSILFVVVLHRQVSGVLYGRLMGDAITALAGLVLIRHTIARRFRRDLLDLLLRYSVPLIPTAIAFWALNYIDRWVLIHYKNLTLVGIYAVAVKISMLMVLLNSAFQLAWGPFAYAHAREAEAGRTFSRVLTLYAALASFLALAIGLFAPEGLSWIVPEAYRGAATAGGLLAFGVVAYGGYSIVGVGANLAFRTDLQSWCSVAAALVNFGLAMALVRTLGLLGVAIATLAGFLVSAVLLYRGSQKVYPLPYRGLRAVGLFGVAVSLWAVATWAAHVLEAQARYPLGLALRILALVAFTLVALPLARRMPLPNGAAGPAASPTTAPGA